MIILFKTFSVENGKYTHSVLLFHHVFLIPSRRKTWFRKNWGWFFLVTFSFHSRAHTQRRILHIYAVVLDFSAVRFFLFTLLCTVSLALSLSLCVFYMYFFYFTFLLWPSGWCVCVCGCALRYWYRVQIPLEPHYTFTSYTQDIKP